MTKSSIHKRKFEMMLNLQAFVMDGKSEDGRSYGGRNKEGGVEKKCN